MNKKKIMKKTGFSYFETLESSFKSLFSNPKILIIILIIGLVIPIFMILFQTKVDINSLPDTAMNVIPYFFIYIICLIILQAWLLFSTNKIILGKKLSTWKDFNESFRIIGKLILMSIYLFLIMAGVSCIFLLLFIISGAVTVLNATIGITLLIICGILFIIAMTLLSSAFMFTPIILMTDNLDAGKTISKTYEYFMINKKKCLLTWIIYIMMIIIISILSSILFSAILPSAEMMTFYMLENPIYYYLMTAPANIISALIGAAGTIFIFKVYKSK